VITAAAKISAWATEVVTGFRTTSVSSSSAQRTVTCWLKKVRYEVFGYPETIFLEGLTSKKYMDKMDTLAIYQLWKRRKVMTRVTATEFKNNIGAFSDAAMSEPVIITSHQRDRLVLLSADEYRRLMGITEGVTDSDKERITRGLERHRNTIMELANR
jgi:prevent-host-death family protein